MQIVTEDYFSLFDGFDMYPAFSPRGVRIYMQRQSFLIFIICFLDSGSEASLAFISELRTLPFRPSTRHKNLLRSPSP